MNLDGYAIESTFQDGIHSDSVLSLDNTSEIILGGNEIDIVATNVKINGTDIESGFVTNPMSDVLTGGQYNIIDIDIMKANSFQNNESLNSIRVSTSDIQINGNVDFQSNDIYDINSVSLDSIYPVSTINFDGYNNSGTAPSTYQSYGLRFTLTEAIRVTQVGIDEIHWVSANHSNRNFKLWVEGNTVTPLYTQAITYASLSSGRFIEDVEWYVPAGTYRVGISSLIGEKYNTITPASFDSRFTTVNGVYYSSTGGAGSYPNNISTANVPMMGFMYLLPQTPTSDAILTIDRSVISTDPVSDEATLIFDSHIDMNDNSLINVSSINNLTPYGGVFLTTSQSAQLTASVTETSIFNGATSLGALTYAPNMLEISSYSLIACGTFNSHNGDTLTLRLYTGVSSSTLIAEFVISLTGVTSEYFKCETNFSIQTLGSSGVGKILSDIAFTYGDGTTVRGSQIAVLESTNFDTTVENTLDITAQFSSTNAGNSIQVSGISLHRKY